MRRKAELFFPLHFRSNGPFCRLLVGKLDLTWNSETKAGSRDSRDVCVRLRNNEITGGKSGPPSLCLHSAALRPSLGWRAGGRSSENSCRAGTVVVVAHHRRVRSNGAVNVSRVHTYNLTSTLPSLRHSHLQAALFRSDAHFCPFACIATLP